MSINRGIKNNKSSNNKGFTLIEVLVAMAIFSIGILAVGSMQLAATRGSSSARLSTEAVAIAQAQAETLILAPYANVLPGSPPGFPVGAYTVSWVVYGSGTGTPWGAVAVNTRVVQVTATSLRGGTGRRSAIITFVKGQDI